MLITLIALILFAFIFSNYATSPGVQDAALTITKALPAAASTTATSTSIDTGAATAAASQTELVEYLLTAPALNTTQLPDTRTVTYNVIVSANSDLSSPTTLIGSAIVQTGAGGAGAATASYRFRLPSTAARYVGFTAVTGASTGDCSAKSATLAPLF